MDFGSTKKKQKRNTSEKWHDRDEKNYILEKRTGQIENFCRYDAVRPVAALPTAIMYYIKIMCIKCFGVTIANIYFLIKLPHCGDFFMNIFNIFVIITI